ncbi:MAG: TetR/AcrR family transcriptional repressor of nem operon [Hyphomicrobiaceae bacterium]|jgi:TetR/AcrR family transcriptional repressor of nem operon
MAPVKQPATNATSTKQRILQVATRLMQQRGFHGFTFQDIAKELGVSHVAVHHHYKTKGALGAAALQAYTAHFVAELATISASARDPRGQLQAYAKLFEAVADGSDRVCLCSIMAAELVTLPDTVKPEVLRFYEHNEEWLAKVLAAATGKRSTTQWIKQQATSFFALLGGAMISARAFADPSRLTSAASLWIGNLPKT